jgi:hypothetical protein
VPGVWSFPLLPHSFFSIADSLSVGSKACGRFAPRAAPPSRPRSAPHQAVRPSLAGLPEPGRAKARPVPEPPCAAGLARTSLPGTGAQTREHVTLAHPRRGRRRYLPAVVRLKGACGVATQPYATGQGRPLTRLSTGKSMAAMPTIGPPRSPITHPSRGPQPHPLRPRLQDTSAPGPPIRVAHGSYSRWLYGQGCAVGSTTATIGRLRTLPLLRWHRGWTALCWL